MVEGGGIIANAVKDLFRVVGKDAGRDAAKDAARVAERDALKKAEQDAAKRAAADAEHALASDAEHDLSQDGARNLLDKTTEGDPVDVVTGAVVQHQVDVSFPGMLPLLLARTHLSSYRLGRWFGPSWASTLDQRLEVSAAGVWYLAPDGAQLAYPRAADGRLARLPVWGARLPLSQGPDGGFTVDGRLHFAQRLDPDGRPRWPLAALTDPNGHRVDLDYRPDGALAAVRHSGGYLVEVDTAGGRVVALRCAGVTLVRYGYDGAGNLAEVVNSSGLPMRFEYDQAGRMTRWVDRNGSWYRFGYDERGRCVVGENPAGYLNSRFDYQDGLTTVTDAVGAVRRFEYNQAGQVVAETDPLGGRTTSSWDSYDRLLSRTDPLGRTTSYRYDQAGRRTGVVRPDGRRASIEYEEHGRPAMVTGAGRARWQRRYDQRGNLVAITDPSGATSRYTRDARGGLSTITDALGTVRRVTTNAAGLALSVTDHRGQSISYAYDAFGRVSAVTDPLGNTVRLGWTVEGRLAWRARPGGGTERWGYDPEGNLVSYADAAGHLTRLEYTHFDVPAARTGPDGARTLFGYDGALRLTSLTDPRGLVWRYEYDAAGRLVGETDYDGRTLTNSYDAAGQLVARTNGAGQRIEYTRDRAGAVVQQQCGDQVATFGYDPEGWLTRAANADGEVVLERDAMGRVLAEHSGGGTVLSGYDPLGRRVYRRTGSGAESHFEYTPNSELAALHTAGHSLWFGYDAAGHEVARSLDRAVLLTHTWDAGHHLTAQTITGPGSRPVQHRAYTHHPDGRLAGYHDAVSGGRGYHFDTAGRLTGLSGQFWSERYEYDPAGNPVTARCATTQPAPPAGDESSGGREYTGNLLRSAGRTSYEYDAQSRLTTRTLRTLSGQRRRWRYEWDANDRLTAVTTPDGHRWLYTYDPLGRRVAKQHLDAGGAAVERVDFGWDGDNLTEATRAGQTTTWTYDPAGRRPLTQAETDQRFYAIVTDLIGTPTELLEASGALAWHRAGTGYGADIYARQPGADCPLRFPGQYHDPETGLHYNRFRYYDPQLARYLSPDQLGLNPGINPFGYVPDPTAEADPLALSPYGQVPYRSDDLSEMAFQHRKAEGLSSGRNVAVYEYTDANGATQHLISANDPGGLHSEEILDNQLTAAGIGRDSVTRIYSERVPCSTPGHDCAVVVGRYQNADLTWSFSGTTAENSSAIYRAMTGS